MKNVKKLNKLPKYLSVKQEAKGTAEIDIDGEIVTDEYEDSDTSAAGFRDLLKQLGNVKTINLHINSPGGSVFEGIAIYNMLKSNKASVNVYVDGLAASIASVIAMAGDTITMPANAMMMIHKPWSAIIGNAKELRKQADDLDKINEASKQSYLQKAGDKLDEDTLDQLLDAETWLTAQEAFDYGLIDKVDEPNKAAACVDRKFIDEHYHNVPKNLLAHPDQVTDGKAEEKPKSKEPNNDKQLSSIREQAKAESDALAAELLNIKEDLLTCR